MIISRAGWQVVSEGSIEAFKTILFDFKRSLLPRIILKKRPNSLVAVSQLDHTQITDEPKSVVGTGQGVIQFSGASRLNKLCSGDGFGHLFYQKANIHPFPLSSSIQISENLLNQVLSLNFKKHTQQ